jgi:hypothetical protein
MNTLRTAGVVTLIMAGAITGVRADDEVTINSSETRSASISAEDRATAACAEAFIGKILPGSHTPLRLVSRSSSGGFSNEFLDQTLEVTLEMSAASTGKLLADSVCTVTRSAKVDALWVRVHDPATLAALRPNEVRLAAIAR